MFKNLYAVFYYNTHYQDLSVSIQYGLTLISLIKRRYKTSLTRHKIVEFVSWVEPAKPNTFSCLC
jgi:hypothetical protein